MFTGIVEEIGTIKSFDGSKLVVECVKVLENTQIGDSIAIDGCCQTVVSMTNTTFSADVSAETLKITKGFKSGEKVNLERALTPQTRMGGHIVQGHVDGTAKYLGNMTFQLSSELDKYVVYKGSITVNGVSLTVSENKNKTFAVAVIPHTLEKTNLKFLKPGDLVNIETDILGRYVEKFLYSQNNNITENFLKENGFY
ncbi:riboflavin synthase [bacterium]|uniref:Riboflavin synthase n=1 Tax=Candidatus Scatenecus faecavium TaxID=2840915 RepID=A0A9D1FUP9_9BACT|nr:riboflavin synthase [bacterium]HIS82054.1 riboflavin synthase [Candidatus Scatenecus faecavium]